MTTIRIKSLLSLLALFIPSIYATPLLELGERAHPVVAEKGMVVTSNAMATQAALDILKQGGNAIDAAVTAGFVLAVVQPRSGNIGGGGFMLVNLAKNNQVLAIDYRETAPKQAHKDMFLDTDKNVDKQLSRYSHQAAGTPGTVAGLVMALEKYGTMPLKKILQPAIGLAEKGFIVDHKLSQAILAKEKHLAKWPASQKVFFKKKQQPYLPGDRFIQKDLANTLKRIAKNGAPGFYQGKTAELVVAEMQKHNGLISLEDLKNYQPKVRKPIQGNYRGHEIYSMTSPSSGGVHIVQILNMLEHYPLQTWGHNSAETIHVMAETMKLAYADRSKYLGDSDFVHVPFSGLTSKKYAKHLVKNIETKQAKPSQEIAPNNPIPYESNETTHYSVVDQWGNAVSNTYTINFSFGSGIVVDGAGFLLNNEMDDFSAKAGVPNAYGLIGGKANQIEPYKRMLSSMSPTIVKKSGKVFLVTGSPGGSRIITTTLQVILNVIDHRLNIQSAVNAPRIHHQWLPEEIRIEQGISNDTIKLLATKGHKLTRQASMGSANSILVTEKGQLHGAADPRRGHSLALGF